jgi:hypothetical protein
VHSLQHTVRARLDTISFIAATALQRLATSAHRLPEDLDADQAK